MKTSTKVLMCLAGVALVALGVICIVYPASTILSLAWLLGLMMLVAGFSTFGAWANLRTFNPYSGFTFFTALMQVLLGLFLLINPTPLAVGLPFIFAFWVLFEGMDLAIDSFSYKRVGYQNWWLLLIIGLMVAGGGFYGLFFNPSTSAAVLSWFVGLAIIFNGIGYWVKVTVVTKLEKRLNTLKDRFGRVFEIEDVEPIK